MPEDNVPYNPNPQGPEDAATTPEPAPSDGALSPDDLAQVKAQLEEEQKARSQAAAAAEAANTRIAELETALSARDQEIATRQEKVATLEKSLAVAAGKYRDMLLATRPAIPPELVTGATIEEVDTSLQKATDLVERVRKAVQAQATIPAGAPVRGTSAIEGLSPGEKIRLGVKGK